MTVANWSPEYITGNRQIDQQHQELFAMFNHLHNAMMSGTAKTEVKAIIKELIHYTHTHFKLEENIMQIYKYPNFLHHKQKHDQLLKQADELADKFEKNENSTLVVVELSTFLSNWLIHHIRGEDQPMITFLKQKLVK
jgi:hemerythrin